MIVVIRNYIFKCYNHLVPTSRRTMISNLESIVINFFFLIKSRIVEKILLVITVIIVIFLAQFLLLILIIILRNALLLQGDRIKLNKKLTYYY